MTDAKLEKKRLRREREIAKWQREKLRPKSSMYLAYMIFIICLVYITDEVASQIGTLMKTEIANDLFAKYGESSVGLLDIVTMLVVPFQALAIVYKPLADRFGRKVFLIINTFGMSLSMLLIFLSDSIIVYVLGACIVQFFIPHDMQVVYIMETAPSKHRARIYSAIKFFANMGVMLIPLLRRLLMHNASEWRNVYLVPAVVGLVTCGVALFFARETDAFIDSRLKYLRMTDEERALDKRNKNTENAQGGVIPALKFAFKHRQLRWLYIVGAIANVGFITTINYQVILSYGYAQSYIDAGTYSSFTDELMNVVSIGPVTTALFMFPVGSAVAQVIMGFISDSRGRKTAAIVTCFNCLLAFIGFSVGAKLAWPRRQLLFHQRCHNYDDRRVCTDQPALVNYVGRICCCCRRCCSFLRRQPASHNIARQQLYGCCCFCPHRARLCGCTHHNGGKNTRHKGYRPRHRNRC